MRNEHCKRCGTEMIPSPDHIDVCLVCREPQKLLCPKCDEKTLVQVHSHSYIQSLMMEPLVAYNKFRKNGINTFQLNAPIEVKV
jgi:hypothetical protein